MNSGSRKYRPCDRCGRVRQIKSDRKTNVCRDCMDADPAYVLAVTGRKKIA